MVLLPWCCRYKLAGRPAPMDLALVRWYKGLQPERGDVLVKYGCTKLEWSKTEGAVDLAVVPFNDIVRRAYVVPDFST